MRCTQYQSATHYRRGLHVRKEGSVLIKRIIGSLTLGALLVLALAVPAFAQDDPNCRNANGDDTIRCDGELYELRDNNDGYDYNGYPSWDYGNGSYDYPPLWGYGNEYYGEEYDEDAYEELQEAQEELQEALEEEQEALEEAYGFW
jgi:hypothetical protein